MKATTYWEAARGLNAKRHELREGELWRVAKDGDDGSVTNGRRTLTAFEAIAAWELYKRIAEPASGPIAHRILDDVQSQVVDRIVCGGSFGVLNIVVKMQQADAKAFLLERAEGS